MRMRSNKLSAEQERACERLRTLWAREKARIGTQADMARLCGWTTQGAFNQYLACRIPMGVEALLLMSRALRVHPDEINPELWSRVTFEHLDLVKRDVTRTVVGDTDGAAGQTLTDQVFVTSKQLADIDEYLKLTANNQEIISKIIAALIQDGGSDSRQTDQKISA